MSTEKRVSVRVDDDLKKLVKNVVDKTGITETTLVEATLKALCDYFEETGEITLPLVVLPKSALKKKTAVGPSGTARPATASSISRTVLHGANEPDGTYRSTKPKSKAPNE